MALLIHNCCLAGAVQMIEEEETERQERDKDNNTTRTSRWKPLHSNECEEKDKGDKQGNYSFPGPSSTKASLITIQPTIFLRSS